MNISKARGTRYRTRLLRISLAVVIGTFTIAQHAHAQLVSPVTLKYAFSVPIARVIPNSCTGGFVLVKGTVKLGVTTVLAGQVPFAVGVTYTSTGTGQDALADGTLVLDGTQKANYTYSSQTVTDAGFPATPLDFMQDPPLRDYLARLDGDQSDELLVDTAIDLTFTNGVPSAPVLRGLSVACSAIP